MSDVRDHYFDIGADDERRRAEAAKTGWPTDRGRVASNFPCPYCGKDDWVFITGIDGVVIDLECPNDAMTWSVNTHYTHADRLAGNGPEVVTE